MMRKSNWLSLVFFTFFGYLIAQQAIPFKTQNEFYIYGDALVIGNNILSKKAKEPFNNANLTNDDIDMVYVDIDDDETTFSSSSANLILPDNYKKIKYAALYWSATYSYEQGYRQESGEHFLFQGKRVKNRGSINTVKLKLPNQSYKEIEGTIIFDGARDNAFTLNSPYACMADVTKFLRHTDIVNGEYTIANIVATKGFVSGGSAAGWLLYVIYEAPTKNPKYITTYNGFAHVSGEPVQLKFSNFKSLEKGGVKTMITFAALEGDSALKEDECIIVNPNSKRALLLNTNQRPGNNFFNSKITIENNTSNARYPNSENTLGFDIISMSLPESSQPLIDNTTTEVDMVFNTKADRFYLFFTAFQTEISKGYYEEKRSINYQHNKNTLTIADPKPKKTGKKHLKKEVVETAKTKPIKKVKENNKTTEIPDNQAVNSDSLDEDKRVFRPKTSVENSKNKLIESRNAYNPETIEDKKNLPVWLRKKQEEFIDDKSIYKPESSLEETLKSGLVLNRENYEKLLTKEDYVYETQSFKRILNQEPTFVEGINKGYYIIANLVYDFDSAVKSQNELLEKGVNSKIFKDPKEDKFYIYLFNSDNFYDVFMLRKAFIKSSFLKEVWILNINIEKKLIKRL